MRAALGDDELLGKALKGDSWRAWRIVLTAAMGEALTDDERVVWRELTGGREREPGVMVEEFHAICGRRSGKTKAVSTAAVYLAALCDHSDKLRRSCGRFCRFCRRRFGSHRGRSIRGIFSEAPGWLRGSCKGKNAPGSRPSI
jgi:hypothetical protein